jgi:hypothetical protein
MMVPSFNGWWDPTHPFLITPPPNLHPDYQCWRNRDDAIGVRCPNPVVCGAALCEVHREQMRTW